MSSSASSSIGPAPPPPTHEETLRALLDSTNREAVPIRRTFVQQTKGEGGGPLHEFVRRQDERGLDLYLVLHAKASSEDWSVTLGGKVWARVLNLAPTANGLTAVSKAWLRIENLGLLARAQRRGRTACVVLLDEAGLGHAYTRPLTADDDRWFSLPHEYWLDAWHLRLDLPAKAMLLIALSLPNGFYLPFNKAHDWYGISRKTAQVGMKSLVDVGIVDKVEAWEPAPMSDIGHRQVVNYTLRPPFGPHPDRPAGQRANAAKKRAKAKRPARTAGSNGSPPAGDGGRTKAIKARKGAAKKAAPKRSPQPSKRR